MTWRKLATCLVLCISVVNFDIVNSVSPGDLLRSFAQQGQQGVRDRENGPFSSFWSVLNNVRTEKDGQSRFGIRRHSIAKKSKQPHPKVQESEKEEVRGKFGKPLHFLHKAGKPCGGTLTGSSGRVFYERNMQRANESNLDSDSNGHGNCIWILKLDESPSEVTETRIVVTVEKLLLNLRSSINFYSESSLMANDQFPKALKFGTETDVKVLYKSHANSVVRVKGQSLIVILYADANADSLEAQFRWDVEHWQSPKLRPNGVSTSMATTTALYTAPMEEKGQVEWTSNNFEAHQRSTWVLNVDKSESFNEQSFSDNIEECQGQKTVAQKLTLNLTCGLEAESDASDHRSSTSCSRFLTSSDDDRGAVQDNEPELEDSCDRASFQLFEVVRRGRLRRVLSHCRGTLTQKVDYLSSQLVAFIQTNSTQDLGNPFKFLQISWQLSKEDKKRPEIVPEKVATVQKLHEQPSIFPNRVNSNSMKKTVKGSIKTTKPTPSSSLPAYSPNSKGGSKSKGGKKPAFITTTTTTERSAVFVPFLETDSIIQLQNSRWSPSKLYRCPTSEVILPCTCSLLAGEITAECSGALVTQNNINNLLSRLRRVNRISTGKWVIVSKVQIQNTELTKLDLLPFLGIETKMFDVSFNKKLTRFVVAGNSLAGRRDDPRMIPSSPLIRTRKLRAVDNALTNPGFGNTLLYFAPIMEELMLSKNKLAGNFKSVEEEDIVRDSTVIGGLESTVGADIGFFPGLSSLRELSKIYLGQNRIRRIRGGQFKTNNRLVFLGLSGNEMVELEPRAFQFEGPPPDHLKHKTLTIDLSRNSINESGFPRNHGLDRVGRPVNLNLDENRLESLPAEKFGSFLLFTMEGKDGAKEVNKVSVRNCPLVCGNSMAWLMRLRPTLSRSVLHAWCKNDPGSSVFSTSLVHPLELNRLPPTSNGLPFYPQNLENVHDTDVEEGENVDGGENHQETEEEEDEEEER